MKFGLFTEFQTRPGRSHAEAFREGMNLVLDAERWGLDSVWLAEFHGSPRRSVLSSPIAVASVIAGRTTRLRIGLAVYVLPLNHPLRIAEEIATLDQLSGGRVELGVGRSGFTTFYRAYGIAYEESRRRFDESMEILRRAWSGERFSYQGEFFRIDDAELCPAPVQRPHPPIRVAATQNATFARIGSEGLPIFVGLRGDGTAELRAGLESYRTAWRDAGHPGAGSAFLRVPLYAGASNQAATDDARETLIHYFDRQAQMITADAGKRSDSQQQQATASSLSALSYQDILATRVAVGGPRGLTERLRELTETLVLDGIIAELNPGGMLSASQVRASLEVLCRDVAPAFR